jgi:hypothetical protein
MTSDAFRKLALSLPDTEERAHMNHPDFRVHNRIFATLGYPRSGWAMVALTPEDQSAFMAMKPGTFVPVKGKWGEQGATNVRLREATAKAVRAALRAAWENRARPAARPRARRAQRPRPRAS